MRKIDAHQHFWKFDSARDSWITEEMSVIRRDFLPEELETLLSENRFEGSVIVQSDQSPAENLFQLANAEEHDFIRGVVGWVDLRATDIDKQLQALCKYSKLKGFRHVLQSEHPDFMLDPRFMHGIGLLSKYHFTYDLLLYPIHLPNAEKLVAAFPDQRFVLDHIAKPEIKAGNINDWAKGIKKLAHHPNVYCKISGMVTEADWKNWKVEQFKPYLDTIFEAFGTKRVMFGSDWPVCLVAASYRQVVEIVDDYCSVLSRDQQSAIWSANAIAFYNLAQ